MDRFLDNKCTRMNRKEKENNDDSVAGTVVNNMSVGRNLDEEINRVFDMDDSDRFDLKKFTATNDPNGEHDPNRRPFSEKDYLNIHRKKSYPHNHLPLKTVRSHCVKKRNYGDHRSKRDICGQKQTTTLYDTLENQSKNELPKKAQREITSFVEDQCEEPLLLSSEKVVAHLKVRNSISSDKRVQFIIDAQDSSNSSTDMGAISSKFKRRPHRQSSVRQNLTPQNGMIEMRKLSVAESFANTEEGPSGSATPPGSEHDIIEEDGYQYILQLEEPLHEFVQDDLASHRFDCSKEKRRFSTKSSISSVLTKRRGTESSIISTLKLRKKSYDHSPHEVFVQLDELTGIGEEREWKETARWIKYEEDVEEGTDRWGKPHVASLSFHSLLNLRKCLEKGICMLDLEERELPGIAYRIVERMGIEDLVLPEEKGDVIRALLSRHRHVNEHERFRFMRRNTTSYSSLQNINEDLKNKSKFSVASIDIASTLKSLTNHSDTIAIDMKEEMCGLSSNDDKRGQKECEILKRIPMNAEATTVLIGTLESLRHTATAFIRLAEGIYLPAVTEVPIPVRFMFILMGPLVPDMDYREIGRSLSTLMSNSDFNTKAYAATDKRDLLRAINEFLDYSIVLPPGNWEREALISLRELRAKNEAIRRRRSRICDKKLEAKGKEEVQKKETNGDPLKRTYKLFGGLINDIKRRKPFYVSDFKDGLNCQCFSAAIFIYFAALSAAITFGGLFYEKTNHMIGISETLVATSLSGIIFGFLAGQPLVIIGTTGPLLLFDESLHKFCENKVDYLTMRLYIGFWLVVIATIVAMVEGSVLIKVFTRFTEEIFSSLISLLYIFESLSNIIQVFKQHPLLDIKSYISFPTEYARNETSISETGKKVTNQPNTALFCLIIASGTFFLAYYLRHFRNSKFLGRSVRRALGDFGVPIAIIAMGCVTFLTPKIYMDTLIVPEGLKPSASDRSWFLSPFGINGDFPLWAAFAALIPAILIYILVFMETHISELIISKKERKLKKGSGFHMDIVLVCLTNALCGSIGAPWMCAATVRSVTHVSAVTLMSTTHAPGDKPHVTGVKEQRVSALLVSVMVGMSVLMGPILRFVPMAVLFGVFLYMGISSIEGVQFFERLKLFLMPVKHHTQVAYVRKVKTVKMYIFTLIQLACLALLWVIKSSTISLTFPFFLILMVPLRSQLEHFFSDEELRALDSDEPDHQDQEDEPDFYAESVLPG